MKNQCSKCNEGYYLPINKSPNFKCESCGKIEHCISCNGTLNSPVCNDCEFGYKLILNKCEKKSCIIGSNEKCLSCKDDSEECLSCNDGYFLPDDSLNKTKCNKCAHVFTINFGYFRRPKYGCYMFPFNYCYD